METCWSLPPLNPSVRISCEGWVVSWPEIVLWLLYPLFHVYLRSPVRHFGLNETCFLNFFFFLTMYILLNVHTVASFSQFWFSDDCFIATSACFKPGSDLAHVACVNPSILLIWVLHSTIHGCSWLISWGNFFMLSRSMTDVLIQDFLFFLRVEITLFYFAASSFFFCLFLEIGEGTDNCQTCYPFSVVV